MDMSEEWQILGNPSPEDLTDARLQLHWAVQLVASVGKTYLDPRPDDSHPNTGWDRASRSLAGHVVTAQKSFQAALHPADLTLSLRDGQGNEVNRLALDGASLEQGSVWLSSAIASHIGEAAKPLVPAGYEIPAHAVGEGGNFSLKDGAAFRELSRWFANADLVLTRMADPHGASVRCWPHHFDIGSWIPLGADSDPENAPSIGLGMTPGDDSYPVPYWYLSPYSLPDERPALPLLPDGVHWHTEGWFSAVLTAPGITAQTTSEGQLHMVSQYLESAWDAASAMLGVQPEKTGESVDLIGWTSTTGKPL